MCSGAIGIAHLTVCRFRPKPILLNTPGFYPLNSNAIDGTGVEVDNVFRAIGIPHLTARRGYLIGSGAIGIPHLKARGDI